DGCDVRMIERRQHLRFAGEAGQPVGIGRERIRQHFDGDIAIELGIGGAVDGAHTAFSQFGNDAVVGERLSRRHANPGMVSASCRVWRGGLTSRRNQFATSEGRLTPFLSVSSPLTPEKAAWSIRWGHDDIYSQGCPEQDGARSMLPVSTSDRPWRG